MIFSTEKKLKLKKKFIKLKVTDGGWRDGSAGMSCVVLVEDLDSVPSTHTEPLTLVCNSSSGGLTPSAGLRWPLHAYGAINTQANKHTHTF